MRIFSQNQIHTQRKMMKKSFLIAGKTLHTLEETNR